MSSCISCLSVSLPENIYINKKLTFYDSTSIDKRAFPSDFPEKIWYILYMYALNKGLEYETAETN